MTRQHPVDRADVRVRLAVGAAVLLSVVGLVGCGQDPGPGPLEVGGDSSMTLCVDPTTAVRALGVTYVANPGDDTATITGVTVVDGQGVTEGEAFVVPDGRDVYTVGGPIPPDPADAESVAAWAARTPATGAEVGPGETFQVVLPMSFASDDSSFSALLVDYEIGGRRFSEPNLTAVEVRRPGDSCG